MGVVSEAVTYIPHNVADRLEMVLGYHRAGCLDDAAAIRVLDMPPGELATPMRLTNNAAARAWIRLKRWLRARLA